MKYLLSLLCICLCFINCKNDQSAETDIPTEEPIEEPTSSTTALPAAALETCLSDWTAFYKQQNSLKNLEFTAFHPSETIVLDSLMTFGPDNILEDEVLKNFVLYSPQRTKALDIYSYATLVEEDGKGGWDITAGGPDSEAAIIDLESPDRARYRLLFCGTPCTYEEACWLDEQHLAIAGLYNESGENFYPTIWLADLTTNTIRMYSYPTAVTPPTQRYVQQRLERTFQ